MMLSARPKEFKTLIHTGLVLLILANACGFFLHPSASLPADFLDGAIGLLMGISIGCLLLGVARKSRRPRPE